MSRHGSDDGRAPSEDARRVAIEALASLDTERGGRIADLLDLRGLAPRDAALAREIAFGVVRRQRLLDHVVLGYATRGLPADPVTRAGLRIGAYQLLFLDRIPRHAAVDRSVASVPRRTAGFVNAVLRRIAGSIEERPATDPRTELALGGGRAARLPVALPADPLERAALRASLPEFLVARWAERHGPGTALCIAEASAARPGIHLRAVRVDREELARRLSEDGVETEPAAHPRMLRWTGGIAPMNSRALADGLCTIQDPTSVAAADAVGAAAGERVLDLCAAPGTKAGLLAEAVGSAGEVQAYDPDRVRSRLVTETARRLRVPWLRVVDRPERGAPFDRVLADVPCSNTGVLARRVEVRHRLLPSTIPDLVADQVEILRRALRLVRDGGTVVYSTCSIEPEECDGVVDAVHAEVGGFEVIERRESLPAPPTHDGGYFAVLRRTGSRDDAARPIG